jgi:hypothetical protein
MASFYISNDMWEQKEEIVLFDMGEEESLSRVMGETILGDVASEKQTKLIYIYDFLTMWTFLVELAEIAEPEHGMIYPNLMFAHGEIPDQAPDKEFIAEGDENEELDDDEEFGLDAEDYESLDFDENWN